MFQRLVRRPFRTDSGGNYATLTALFAPVAIGLAAIAVDSAALYTERRQAQSLADLAAITAAANVSRAGETALAVLKDNGVAARLVETRPGLAEEPAVRVLRGRYEPDMGRAAVARFVATEGTPNAVRVEFATTGTRHFGAGLIAPPRITVSATAATRSLGAFSIGTRLAGLDGGIANALLGALVGANLSLSVMDYNALLGADISLFGALDALGSELELTALNYRDLLSVETSIATLARSLATLPEVTDPVRQLLRTVGASDGARALKVKLGDLIALDAAGLLPLGVGGGGAEASLGVVELLTAAGALANGSRQIELSLGATLPGLMSAKLDLGVGQPAMASPWFAYGGEGRVVRTAQTRLLLTVTVGGPGGLIGSSVSLPVYVQLASAEATLASITCPPGRRDRPSMSVLARPGVAELRIASVSGTDLRDFSRLPAFGRATLVSAPLVSIRGQSRVAIENGKARIVTFSPAEIAERKIKSVSTTSLAGSLTASLLGELDLQVNVIGLGIGIPGLATAALDATLKPVAPAVDTLLFSVLAALGVRIGEVDIRALGADCGRAVLVQ